MLECEGDQAAEDLPDSLAGVPECVAGRLLAAGVVLAAEQDEGGGDDAFDGAGDDADGEEAGVVV